MHKIVLFALLLLSNAVFALTIDEIKQQAEQGHALAQAKMASLLLLGREGVAKNDKQAAEWMEKAANQGLVDAQVALAAMYDSGLGVVADREKSSLWYEKAASKGHATSLAILGRNQIAKGSVQFNYQSMRLSAAKTIPNEYAKRFLMAK